VEVNYIALAVPFFMLGIFLELRTDHTVYRFGDALADMSSGVFQQVVQLFLNVLFLAGYHWLYEHHRLFTLPTWAAWIVAIVGVDLVYYWWHRLSHEVNFLWAAHVVHHSSEDYNLAVALRQSIFTGLTGFPMFALLSFLGVPTLIYATVHSFNTLYQFWIHTQLIGKLGPFEKWINTPSLHRVHHAINPRYLDKNYGGTFMIWDRLFGTYAPEIEPCVYGIVKPLASFDVWWTQMHYYVELARISWQAPRWADKLWVWLAPPTWSARGLPQKPPPPEVSPETFVKWVPAIGTGFRAAWLAQFALLIGVTFFFLLLGPRLQFLPRLGAALLIVLWLMLTGAQLEGRVGRMLRSAACVVFSVPLPF
jgi:sterol desaturase/sphingolipid hydroxylase (fatty acid hydroxylase superfamily)